METPGSSSSQDREEIKKKLQHMKKRYAHMQKKLQKSVKQKKVKDHVQKKIAEQTLIHLTEGEGSAANVSRKDTEEKSLDDLGPLQIGRVQLDESIAENINQDGVKLNRKCVSSVRSKKRRSVSFVLEDDRGRDVRPGRSGSLGDDKTKGLGNYVKRGDDDIQDKEGAPVVLHDHFEHDKSLVKQAGFIKPVGTCKMLKDVKEPGKDDVTKYMHGRSTTSSDLSKVCSSKMKHASVAIQPNNTSDMLKETNKLGKDDTIEKKLKKPAMLTDHPKNVSSKIKQSGAAFQAGGSTRAYEEVKKQGKNDDKISRKSHPTTKASSNVAILSHDDVSNNSVNLSTSRSKSEKELLEGQIKVDAKINKRKNTTIARNREEICTSPEVVCTDQLVEIDDNTAASPHHEDQDQDSHGGSSMNISKVSDSQEFTNDLPDDVVCVEETQDLSQLLAPKTLFKQSKKSSGLHEKKQDHILSKKADNIQRSTQAVKSVNGDKSNMSAECATSNLTPSVNNSDASQIGSQPCDVHAPDYGSNQSSSSVQFAKHNTLENANTFSLASLNSSPQIKAPISETFSDPGPVRTSRKGCKRSRRSREFTASDISMKDVIQNSQSSQEGNHTWIEGLIYPVEYYVRKTRSMSGAPPVLYTENLLPGIEGLEHLSQVKTGGRGQRKPKRKSARKDSCQSDVVITSEEAGENNLTDSLDLKIKCDDVHAEKHLKVISKHEERQEYSDSQLKVPSQDSVDITQLVDTETSVKETKTSQQSGFEVFVKEAQMLKATCISSQSSYNSNSSRLSNDLSSNSNSSGSRRNLSLSRKRKGLKKVIRNSVVDLTVEKIDAPMESKPNIAKGAPGEDVHIDQQTSQEQDNSKEVKQHPDVSCKSDLELNKSILPQLPIEVRQQILTQVVDFVLPDGEFRDMKLSKAQMDIVHEPQCNENMKVLLTDNKTESERNVDELHTTNKTKFEEDTELEHQLDLRCDKRKSFPDFAKPESMNDFHLSKMKTDEEDLPTQTKADQHKLSRRKKSVKPSRQQSQGVLESQFSQTQFPLNGGDTPVFPHMGCSPGSPSSGVDTKPMLMLSPTCVVRTKPTAMLSQTSPVDAATMSFSPQQYSLKDAFKFNKDDIVLQENRESKEFASENDMKIILQPNKVQIHTGFTEAKDSKSIQEFSPRSVSVPSNHNFAQENSSESEEPACEITNSPSLDSKHHLTRQSSPDNGMDEEFSPPTNGVVTPPMTSGNILHTSPFADVATATPYGKAEIPMCQSQCDPQDGDEEDGLRHGDDDGVTGFKFAGSFQHDVSDFSSPITGIRSCNVVLDNQKTTYLVVYSAKLIVIWMGQDERDWQIQASWAVAQEEEISCVYPVPCSEDDIITLAIGGNFDKCVARVLRYNPVNGEHAQLEVNLPSNSDAFLFQELCPVSSNIMLIQTTDTQHSQMVYRVTISEDFSVANCSLMYQGNTGKVSLQKVHDANDMAVMISGEEIHLWDCQSGCILQRFEIPIDHDMDTTLIWAAAESGVLFTILGLKPKNKKFNQTKFIAPCVLLALNPATGKSAVVHQYKVPGTSYDSISWFSDGIVAQSKLSVRTTDNKLIIWDLYSAHPLVQVVNPAEFCWTVTQEGAVLTSQGLSCIHQYLISVH